MDRGDRDKWKLLLKTVEFFKIFDSTELDSLLDFSELRKYHLHNFIIKEGEHNDAFYVVLKGEVNIVKNSPLEKRQKINTLSVGECFGEIAVLLREPRSASVMAIGEVAVFFITGGQVSKLPLNVREKLYKQFATNLAKHLKDTNDRVTGVTGGGNYTIFGGSGT